MSYTTIQAAVRDVALQDRVTAGAMKEAINGAPEYVDSEFGAQLRSYSLLAINTFLWPVAVQYETEYEFALNSDNPNPGGDPGVITDAMILSAIQAHWPLNPANIPADLRNDPSMEPRQEPEP